MKEGFDELVGGADLPAAERERLRRVHELLLTVGPPPEVAPELQAPPREEPVRLLPRRRRTTLALIAAALGLAVFGTGYLVGSRAAEPTVERVLTMTGVGDVSAARGTIELLAQDTAGNWPMLVRVRGLEPSVDRRDYYELWLTQGRRARRAVRPLRGRRRRDRSHAERPVRPPRLRRLDRHPRRVGRPAADDLSRALLVGRGRAAKRPFRGLAVAWLVHATQLLTSREPGLCPRSLRAVTARCGRSRRRRRA